MKPFFYVTHYWELHWIYALAKETEWPVVALNDVIVEFCKKNKLNLISEDECRMATKVVVVTPHFGMQKDFVMAWVHSGKKAYLLQRAFDTSIAVFDEFWSMKMDLFSKYLVASQFDYDLLYPKRGDRVVLTGSPRLWMASEAPKKSLKKIYQKVGTDKFYVATVIGGLPIHDDTLPDHYMNELQGKSPYKIVYKMHPDGNLQLHQERYPQDFFWDDSRLDPWETYKLIAASQGIITPSSFMAIEATIMGKPVILDGDVHPDEYARQSGQRQEARIPRGISSSLDKPQFNQAQEELRSIYKYDKSSIDRIVREVLS